MEVSFKYESPDTLRVLVNALSENSVEMSVGLKPVLPEQIFSEIYKLTQKIEVIRDQIPWNEQEKPMLEVLLRLGDIAEEYQILPLTSLLCDYSIGRGRPELKNEMVPTNESSKVFAAAHRVMPPAHMNDRRPLSIYFREARGTDNIQLIKTSVLELPKEKWSVSSVYVGLNPRDWSSEYYGGTDYDAHLSAGKGKITISGDWKEEMVAQKYTEQVQKMLVGEQLLLVAPVQKT
ncbi:MAG: hypothetical protein AABY01_03950 [Nanoarchaeota archaeon]